jgi:uncharacterized protein YdaU (DUF1376 family)
MKNKAPAFQFYPADFISDELVQIMSNEEVGVYVKMLCSDWINGGLPSNKAVLCRMFNCDQTALDMCLSSFVLKSDRYFNKRLIKERKKQAQYRQKQSKNAQSRWNKRVNPMPPQCDGSAVGVPTQCSLSSSSSSPSDNTPIVPKGTGFNALSVELPPNVSPAIWAEWCQHRIEIRKKMTQTSTTRQLNMLKGQGANADLIISNAIEKGWTGLHPLSKQDKPATNHVEL